MGEFNVDKLTGDLIPTSGYGGMIKINGSTISSLATALAGLTEDQKNRCEILIYLNSVTVTNFYVLRRYNKSVGAGGGEVYDTYSNSYVDVSINNETTTLRQASIYLFIYNNNAIVRKAYGSNGYDLTSSVTSWSILYQDDSVTGGNTYPASQVLLSDGVTSVEDAIDEVDGKIPLLSVRQLPAITVSATAQADSTIIVDWSNVDKSKILYSWVHWNNYSSDVPRYVLTYYDNQNKGALYKIVHNWSVTQNVKLYVNYIYMD